MGCPGLSVVIFSREGRPGYKTRGGLRVISVDLMCRSIETWGGGGLHVFSIDLMCRSQVAHTLPTAPSECIRQYSVGLVVINC